MHERGSNQLIVWTTKTAKNAITVYKQIGDEADQFKLASLS